MKLTLPDGQTLNLKQADRVAYGKAYITRDENGVVLLVNQNGETPIESPSEGAKKLLQRMFFVETRAQNGSLGIA